MIRVQMPAVYVFDLPDKAVQDERVARLIGTNTRPATIDEIRAQVQAVYKSRGYNTKATTMIAVLAEELGELAEQILCLESADYVPSQLKQEQMEAGVISKRGIAHEIGDLIVWAVSLANILGVDIYFHDIAGTTPLEAPVVELLTEESESELVTNPAQAKYAEQQN